ncbi:hypothetical protein Q5752_004688 [Cryptotrichosporon argae]
MPLPVPVLIGGMFLTGCANSLLSKYQDKVCVENCTPGSEHARVNFEQPVWQTLNMFAGEFLCVIPLLYKAYTSPSRLGLARAGPPEASLFSRVLARLPLGARGAHAHYLGVSQEEVEGDDGGDGDAAEAAEGRMRGWAVGWMWFPAFFDICGTTLMNVGLILTPVSVYQMSRGALVLWVGVLSVLFLRRHLWLYQWFALVVVMAGVGVVGLAGTLIQGRNTGTDTHAPGGVDGFVGVVSRGGVHAWVERAGEIATRSDDDPAKVALGIVFILIAQVFTATQYVVEEKIMSHYKVEPLAAVALEGLFGGLTTALAMPFLHVLFASRSPFFDVPRGWREITSTPAVAVSCALIMLSIGSFNYFGLSVTSRVSATTRSTVDTCRTLGIWLVSLGIGWEALVWPFSLLQVTGFALLVYGTFLFNGLVAPLFFKPPPAIHLPHEPELEETAEVPAAQAQGRAGYDIVPGADEHRAN